jgi:hypothetical protein
MPVTDALYNRFLSAAKMAASGIKKVLIDNEETRSRLEKELLIPVRRNLFSTSIKKFALDWVSDNRDLLKDKVKYRGGGGTKGRTVPFKSGAYELTLDVVKAKLAEGDRVVKREKSLKRTVGRYLRQKMGGKRVSVEDIEKLGPEKFGSLIDGFLAAGDNTESFSKIPKTVSVEVGARGELKPVETPAIRKRLIGPRPDPGPPMGQAQEQLNKRLAAEKIAALSGIKLTSVKDDDLDAMLASQRAYEYKGATKSGFDIFWATSTLDKLSEYVETEVLGTRTEFKEDPTIPGYETVYSDEFQTVFKSPSKIIVAYTGSDDRWDWIPNFKIGVMSREAFNDDPRIRSVMKQTDLVLKSLTSLDQAASVDPREIVFTGHSIGAATAFRAEELFAGPKRRASVFALPFVAVHGEGKDFIDGERRRAYAVPGDTITDRLLEPNSQYHQPNTFILPEGYRESQTLIGRHSMGKIVEREQARRAADPTAGAQTEAEVEDELAREDPTEAKASVSLRGSIEDPSAPPVEDELALEDPAEAPSPPADEDAPKTGEEKTTDAKTEQKPEEKTVSEEEVTTKKLKYDGERFRGVPGVGVPPPQPGVGTFADVVRDDLQEMVNRQFHGYGKPFRPYVDEFIASGRLAAMREQTNGDGHQALDLLIRNYGSELPIEPFDHRDLGEQEMRALYTEVAAGVDWFLRNPERVPARAINRLAVLLETKLFPAPPGTAPEAMTDNQLLAQMATRGAVVKLDPTTERGRALEAVKSMMSGQVAGSPGEDHPSGAATGDAAEAPMKVAMEPDPLFDGVVVPEGDGFRLDLTQFPDNSSGATGTRLAPAIPFDEGYDLAFE